MAPQNTDQNTTKYRPNITQKLQKSSYFHNSTSKHHIQANLSLSHCLQYSYIVSNNVKWILLCLVRVKGSENNSKTAKNGPRNTKKDRICWWSSYKSSLPWPSPLCHPPSFFPSPQYYYQILALLSYSFIIYFMVCIISSFYFFYSTIVSYGTDPLSIFSISMLFCYSIIWPYY